MRLFHSRYINLACSYLIAIQRGICFSDNINMASESAMQPLFMLTLRNTDNSLFIKATLVYLIQSALIRDTYSDMVYNRCFLAIRGSQ